MPGKLVCEGAECSCNQGQMPTALIVTTQQLLSIGGLRVATVMDYVPMTNVVPFGICQQLTKVAGGTPTPCAPMPAGPWAPGSSVQSILGMKALTAYSTMVCGVGGQISIGNPANATGVTSI